MAATQKKPGVHTLAAVRLATSQKAPAVHLTPYRMLPPEPDTTDVPAGQK